MRQSGGLPALAARVSALEALLGQLQAEIDNLTGAASYTGDYVAFHFENNQFGCGVPLGSVPLNVYLQRQSASSTSAFSATSFATADGDSLTFDGITTLRHLMRLSGIFEKSDFWEDGFELEISPTGTLSYTDDPLTEVFGQMSEDGSSFTIIARGSEQEQESNCTDAWTILTIGVRI